MSSGRGRESVKGTEKSADGWTTVYRIQLGGNGVKREGSLEVPLLPFLTFPREMTGQEALASLTEEDR